MVGDTDLDLEDRMMGRALLAGRGIGGQRMARRLGPFLQPGLGVFRRAVGGHHTITPMAANENIGGRQSGIEIERPQQRLEGVSQQRGIFAAAAVRLALGKMNQLPDIEPVRDSCQGLAAHQGGEPLGQWPLLFIWKGFE